MIKKDTIVSTTDGRLTLLQWLKKVEKALKDSTVTGFTATPDANGDIVFSMDFADGTSYKSGPVAVGSGLPDGYAVDGAGNVTIAGALTANNNGNVEVNGKELFLDGRRVKIRSYKEGVWDNVDFEIQSTDGRYITVIRIRKNDIDGKQVRVMPGGSMDVDDELTANTLYIGGRIWRLMQTSDDAGKRLTASLQNAEGTYDDVATLDYADGKQKGLSLVDSLKVQVLPKAMPAELAKKKIYGLFKFEMEAGENPIYYYGAVLCGSVADNKYKLVGGLLLPLDYSGYRNNVILCGINRNNEPGFSIKNGVLFTATAAYGGIAYLNDILTVDNGSRARYQHTVTIKFDSQNSAVLVFTAMSSSSKKVTSFQNLAAVFGNRRLECSGGDSSGSRFAYLDTNQSDPNNYVVGYINSTGFHTDETLGTLTGTGLTVEDNVIIP